ncbi:MAG: ATP-binding protein [Candidatus Delongbacteria bacterium]|nr:ATP-binding protein [Candidatus Delongbacteria bacterium]
MHKRYLLRIIEPHLYHKNAIVITGMRQVGKTTLMRMLYNKFEGKKLFFDLDNPLDQMTFENIDYNVIYRDLADLANLNDGEKLLVCVDEIQNFPEITKIMKYLIDHFQVKFIVTGSSNYYLRNLFPESLSGRKFLYILTPLSFREFLYFKGQLNDDDLYLDIESAIQPKSKIQILRTREYYTEYLEFGGFPEVVLSADRETKNQILKNIFASFFEKDIKVFTELKNIRELRDLILLLASRNGNILDVTKLSSELEINRVKIYNYLEFLEGTFFLKLISKYSKNIDRTVVGGKKVYFSDTGILNLVAKVTEGQVLETAVANQLANYGELSFYNKRNKSEIDFILNKEIAFEVKQKATENDMKKLKNLCSEIGIERKYLISNSLSEIEGVVYPWFL